MRGCAKFTRLLYDETVQIASNWTTRLSIQFCLYLRALDLWESKRRFLVLFTPLPSTTFAKCGQMLFLQIILGVFLVWKKVLVLVKRRAVSVLVCQ